MTALKEIKKGSIIMDAYNILMKERGPVDLDTMTPGSPATINAKQDEDEDEETKKTLRLLGKALAEHRITLKEYEDVIGTVFRNRAPSESGDVGNWSDARGSATTPHSNDEIGYSTSSDKPKTQGYTSQRGYPTTQGPGPSRSGFTSESSMNDSGVSYTNPSSIDRGPGASRGPASYRNPQSGLYPQETYVTTSPRTGGLTPGNSQSDYADISAGNYRPTKDSWGPSSAVDTAVGTQQPIKKGEIIQQAYEVSKALNKTPEALRVGGSMGYRDEDQSTAEAGGVARMEDEEYLRRKAEDMAEARKLEEIGQRLTEEANDEESSDTRLKPREESRKREMARKAFEQAANILSKYKGSTYPSGYSATYGKKRHGAGF